MDSSSWLLSYQEATEIGRNDIPEKFRDTEYFLIAEEGRKMGLNTRHKILDWPARGKIQIAYHIVEFPPTKISWYGEAEQYDDIILVMVNSLVHREGGPQTRRLGANLTQNGVVEGTLPPWYWHPQIMAEGYFCTGAHGKTFADHRAAGRYKRALAALFASPSTFTEDDHVRPVGNYRVHCYHCEGWAEIEFGEVEFGEVELCSLARHQSGWTEYFHRRCGEEYGRCELCDRVVCISHRTSIKLNSDLRSSYITVCESCEKNYSCPGCASVSIGEGSVSIDPEYNDGYRFAHHLCSRVCRKCKSHHYFRTSFICPTYDTIGLCTHRSSGLDMCNRCRLEYTLDHAYKAHFEISDKLKFGLGDIILNPPWLDDWRYWPEPEEGVFEELAEMVEEDQKKIEVAEEEARKVREKMVKEAEERRRREAEVQERRRREREQRLRQVEQELEEARESEMARVVAAQQEREEQLQWVWEADTANSGTIGTSSSGNYATIRLSDLFGVEQEAQDE